MRHIFRNFEPTSNKNQKEKKTMMEVSLTNPRFKNQSVFFENSDMAIVSLK